MRTKTTLAAVLIAGTAVFSGCAGSNTDLERGETDCQGSNIDTAPDDCDTIETQDPADNT